MVHDGCLFGSEYFLPYDDSGLNGGEMLDCSETQSSCSIHTLQGCANSDQIYVGT